MGAWIEILFPRKPGNVDTVAPLVGAWIEIEDEQTQNNAEDESLLSWERGLK